MALLQTTTQKRIIETYFEQVWNANDTSFLNHLVAPDFYAMWLIHGVPICVSMAEYTMLTAKIHKTFMNLQYHIEAIIETADGIEVSVTFRGKQIHYLAGIMPISKSVCAIQCFRFVMADERIQSEQVIFDLTSESR